MEIRNFAHESVVRNGRKYFAPRTLDNLDLRSSYLANPEEYVRQDVIRTLHEDYGYPLSLMMLEFGLQNGTRIDLTVMAPSVNGEDVFDEIGEDIKKPFPMPLVPFLIVECKKATEPLIEQHVKQGLKYAQTLDPTPSYLVVTNSNTTRCFQIASKGGGKIKYEEVPDIPRLREILKESWAPKCFDVEQFDAWFASLVGTD